MRKIPSNQRIAVLSKIHNSEILENQFGQIIEEISIVSEGRREEILELLLPQINRSWEWDQQDIRIEINRLLESPRLVRSEF